MLAYWCNVFLVAETSNGMASNDSALAAVDLATTHSLLYNGTLTAFYAHVFQSKSSAVLSDIGARSTQWIREGQVNSSLTAKL